MLKKAAVIYVSEMDASAVEKMNMIPATGIADALEKAKARLKANVNFDLVMELLLLTIKEN